MPLPRKLPVAALLIAAVSAAAEPAWDGAVVTRLAEELHATLGEGLELATQAPPQETAFQQRTRDAAVKRMQTVHDIAGEYAAKLRGGWSRDESEPFFHQLRASIADAREVAGDAVPTQRNAEVLDRVDALVEEIGAHYTGM